MRVGAADVPVRRLVRSQCVYVTVGTTRTAMKEIALMTTLPLYSTHALAGAKVGSEFTSNESTSMDDEVSVSNYFLGEWIN